MNLSESNESNVKKGQFSSFRDGRPAYWLAVGILLVSFIVYLPSLQNGFVNWDDQVNIYKNPHVLAVSDWADLPGSIAGIFTSHVMGNYNPLPIVTFALEKLVFGLDSPEWFHFNNILLHLVCVFLVFRIVLALGPGLFTATLCALLFGIHPMRVESVAWVTERKDLLLGTFYFLGLYFYLKAAKSNFPFRSTVIVTVCFVLALLSKIQAVAFPLTLLLVDYYLGRRLELRLIYEKWLYFLLSLTTGLVGIYFLRVDGGLGSNTFFSFMERLFIGSYSYVVYLVKSVIPYEMVPVYPYPAALDWVFYASAPVVIGLLGLTAYLFRKGAREFVFGVLFFTVNIMFVLQVLGAGQGFIADRFSYIPYLGLFFLYAYYLQQGLERFRHIRPLGFAMLTLVLCVYGYFNFEQNKIWRNGETLWTHVAEHYPRSALVWENRAGYYGDQGMAEEALRDFDRAIALKPDRAELYYRRGNVYFNSEYPDKYLRAIQDYSRAVRLAPEVREYLLQRGITYFELGEYGKALDDLNAAEKHGSGNVYLYAYRARAHFRENAYDPAQADMETYLGLVPKDASMWSNLGNVAWLGGNFPKALAAFDRAIALDPNRLDDYYKRAVTHFELGNARAAMQDLKFLTERGYPGIDPSFLAMVQQEL